MKNHNNDLDPLKPGQADLEKEYAELMKLAENAGIADLMRLYGEYKKLIDLSNTYLQQMNPKFSFSTTDTSS